MKKLEGKTALVTGASRGIGRRIALKLASEGAAVVLVARTSGELEAVQREIEAGGGTASIAAADITKPDDCARIVQTVEERHGRLDILVNNAGLGIFTPVRSLSADQFDAMWNLNMRAVFLLTQAVLPMMERQRGGDIVNISSLAGKNFFVNGAGYAASKWALMGFSKSLMLEERQFNIRVVLVCPGSVNTTFSAEIASPDRSSSILDPDDVADTVLMAVTLPNRAMVSELEIRPTNPK